MTLVPVEYECDSVVRLRRCPRFFSCIGDKREYWYLMKTLYSFDPKFGHLRKSGYEWLYWTDHGWDYHTPLQFWSAEEAHREFVIMLKRK